MNAIIAPRTATVTLYQGDDQARLDDLNKRIAAAPEEGDGTRMMHEDDPREALTAERDELAADALERAVVVTIEALGRRKWRSLVSSHPPREGSEADQAMGVNDETFGEALLSASIKAPAEVVADMEGFLDAISDAQFDKLYATAFTLNRTLGVDPKDFMPSAATPKNAATSK